MKKRLFTTVLLCFAFATISAQDFDFGVKGGVNVASLSGNNLGLGTLGSKVSFHIGGMAVIPISEKFAAQPELLYSSQGSKWNFGNISNLKLDYVNLPLLGKYFIIKGLSAEAGVVVGYLLSTNAPDKSDYSSIDIAIAIGASYKLNDNIFFSLRYNKGVTDINNDPNIDFANKNNVFQISAGYSF